MKVLRKKREEKGEVDRVYRIVKDSILQCRVLPGDFLVEIELARRCRTSRTPVREACNRLSQEGWIAQIRHKGYIVPTVSVREIVELYEFRKLLECHTAEQAAEIASAADLAAIAATIKSEWGPKLRLQELVEVNEEFHLAVAAAAGNRRIYDQLKFTLEHVRRLDILGTQKDTGWIMHSEIMKALEAHNSMQARKAMARHIDDSRDRMLKLFGT